MNDQKAQSSLSEKFVEPLSREEKAFFRALKIVLASTISSPFYVSYLLLQSKRTILSQYAKFDIHSDKMEEGADPSMLQMLANEQNHGGIKSGFGLLFLSKIITNSRYGFKFLCFNNISIYRILRDNVISYFSNDYPDGTKAKIGKNLTFPFEYFFLNYLFFNRNFHDNKKYKTFAARLTSENSFNSLKFGLAMTLGEIIGNWWIHEFVKDIKNNYNICNYNYKRVFVVSQHDWWQNQFWKFIDLGLCKIMFYPFNRLKHHALATDEITHFSEEDIIRRQVIGIGNINYNDDSCKDYGQLYAGLPMYLTQFCVYQAAIWGCDLMQYWYQKKYKKLIKRKVFGIDTRNQQRELICNICWVNKKDHVFIRCGHTVCGQCKDKITRCHVCRQRIVKCQRIYL